jgi:hypothetical protein
MKRKPAYLKHMLGLAALLLLAPAEIFAQEGYYGAKETIALGAKPSLLSAALSFDAAQDQSSPQEVVAKVREAASVLSKTGDLSQFNQKHGPWFWGKDSYIFIQDCDKKVIVAHPVKPDIIGKDFMTMKDSKGNLLFVKDYCEEARKPAGIWSEFWWPKPGEKESSRKLTYSLGAKGTPYIVVSGIYDDKSPVDELSKLTSGK